MPGVGRMNGDEGQIKAKREAAARARRLSATLLARADRNRMLDVAVSFDAEADVLEQSMQTPPAPQAMRMQAQQVEALQAGSPAKDVDPKRPRTG